MQLYLGLVLRSNEVHFNKSNNSSYSQLPTCGWSLLYLLPDSPCQRCISSLYAVQVLLVTSSRRPDHWIVPGGGVEPEEEPSVTAIREVLEEAGVCGKLGRCLGVFEVTCTLLNETLLLPRHGASSGSGCKRCGK